MLKIEPRVERTGSTDARRQVEFATLDEVPDYALTTLSHLYNYIIRPFSKWYGVVITGPGPYGRDSGDDSDEWGRRVHLHTGEVLQMRFAPVVMLHDGFEGVSMLSVRLISRSGVGCNVRSCILFPPVLGTAPPVGHLNSLCSISAPRGLHFLLITMFRQHNASSSEDDITDESWTVDPHGYGAVRSTTFSVSKDVEPTDLTSPSKKKGSKAAPLRKSPSVLPPTCNEPFPHDRCDYVAPGVSPFVVAAECVDRDLPDPGRRPCEPINSKTYERMIENVAELVCKDDAQIGKSAVAASIAICELVSGEGILSMMGCDFLKSSLPERLKSPLGMGMILTMSVRLAMFPVDNGLRWLAPCDQVAMLELRTLFESRVTEMEPVDSQQRVDKYALDMVITNAKKYVLNQIGSSNSESKTNVMFNDKLAYWVRMGQSMIAGIFGHGSSCDSVHRSAYGDAWRFHDPLAEVKDIKTVEMQEGYQSFRHPPYVPLTQVHRNRVTLVNLMVECERFLRTGCFEGKRLVPENDIKASKRDLKKAADERIAKAKASSKKGDLRRRVEKVTASQIDNAVKNYNMEAVVQSQTEMAHALLSGPVLHFRHRIECYLVSESQTVKCCDCDAPLHVLQGIVLSNEYGACTHCKAKRCLQCSGKYTFEHFARTRTLDENGTDEVVTFGNTCLRCGTPPPKLKYSNVVAVLDRVKK